MLDGRDHKVKAELVKKITETFIETLGVGPEAVTVIIQDFSRENWAKAGVLFSDR
jgi:4-oxalocrotonate tautomerase